MSSEQADKARLRLDFCSHDAARYACKNWHYSQCIPKSKLVKIGVWENDEFIGCIIYSYGANNMIGKQYGLKMIEVCELTRVALKEHQTEVSRILSISQKLLKKLCPGLRLIISYADLDQGHSGGIYKANGWIYQGIQDIGGKGSFIINGKKVHAKSIYTTYGPGTQNLKWLREHLDPNADFHVTKGKHKFLMPLDSGMRQQISVLSRPYPKLKRVEHEVNASGYHSEESGLIPTHSHQEDQVHVLNS
jgi:hypothetical protein